MEKIKDYPKLSKKRFTFDYSISSSDDLDKCVTKRFFV